MNSLFEFLLEEGKDFRAIQLSKIKIERKTYFYPTYETSKQKIIINQSTNQNIVGFFHFEAYSIASMKISFDQNPAAKVLQIQLISKNRTLAFAYTVVQLNRSMNTKKKVIIYVLVGVASWERERKKMFELIQEISDSKETRKQCSSIILRALSPSLPLSLSFSISIFLAAIIFFFEGYTWVGVSPAFWHVQYEKEAATKRERERGRKRKRDCRKARSPELTSVSR